MLGELAQFRCLQVSVQTVGGAFLCFVINIFEENAFSILGVKFYFAV